jgi:hypothetical protein
MFQQSANRERSRTRLSHWITWCVLIGLLLPGLSGCFGGKQRKGAAGRAAGSAIDPDDITGRWKLSIANRGAQSDVGLLEISYDAKQAENKYSMKLLGLPEDVQSIVLKGLKVTDDGKVDFDIDVPNGVVSNFSGRLDGEAIWGSYLMPHFQLVPCKLERTDLEKLDKPEPTPVSHFEDFMKAQNSNDSYVAMDTLSEKANRSPLLFEVYDSMAGHFKKEKFTKEGVLEFIEKYRKAIEVWGPRLAPLVDLNVGHALAKQELYPELAQSLLETAESKLTDDYPLEFTAKLVDAWILVGKPENALKRLPKLLEEDPANPNLIWLYARAKESAKDTDAAMLAFTKVAVLPGFEQQIRNPTMELASQSAFRLWKSKHDNTTTGFDDFVQKAYLEVMKAFVPQRTPNKRDAKAMVPMFEMFTSTGCAPCIGADIAMEALRKSYSNQEVVILKYHTHSPYLDPLANDVGAARMKYYGASETPAVVFNGQILDQPLGVAVATGAGQILNFLRSGVESEAKKTSPLEIEVTAKRTGDEIEIKANVSGILSLQHHPHLYIALVENDVFCPGPNGILFHDCVVRAFAGGSRGIELPKGNSSHVEKMSLSQLKQELLAQLSVVEMDRKLPLKPMEFRKLQVAAFIQPTFTKVVLQSVLVDVTGDVPPEVKPEAKPEAAAEEKPAEKPEDKPKAEEKPAADAKPAAEEKPAEAKQPEEKPAEEKPAAEKPAAKVEAPKSK